MNSRSTHLYRFGHLLSPTAWVLLLFAFWASGCDTSSSPNDAPFEPIWLHEEWKEAKPAEVGLDASLLTAATQAATAIPRMRSLLVIKDGKLAFESYFNGAEKDDLFDVRSVTKSVVSALAGIAVNEGHISNLDLNISPYFNSYFENVPEQVNDVTVRNLLMMTGGWQYDEWGGTSYQEWIQSREPEKWALSQPRANTPGTTFTYNSSSVHLLSVLLENVVGQPLEQFASSKLFGRIGIIGAEWEQLPGGHPNGGAGIDLKARDLARFGQLYLQKGRSGTSQIIPEAWVTESTTPKHSFRLSNGSLKAVSYGYLWWTDNTNSFPVFYANGYGGQFIYVVPEHNLVVVTTTDYSGLSAVPGSEPQLSISVMNIITQKVLAAVK